MVTIIEYVCAHDQRAIQKLVESKVLQESSIRKIASKTAVRPENQETYFYKSLMSHNKWMRKRGGAIRQVSHYEE